MALFSVCVSKFPGVINTTPSLAINDFSRYSNDKGAQCSKHIVQQTGAHRKIQDSKQSVTNDTPQSSHLSNTWQTSLLGSFTIPF